MNTLCHCDWTLSFCARACVRVRMFVRICKRVRMYIHTCTHILAFSDAESLTPASISLGILLECDPKSQVFYVTIL